MNILLLVLMMAITVEGLIEYTKTLVQMIQQGDKKTFFIQMGALLLSVVFCLLASVDFYNPLGFLSRGTFLEWGKCRLTIVHFTG